MKTEIWVKNDNKTLSSKAGATNFKAQIMKNLYIFEASLDVQQLRFAFLNRFDFWTIKFNHKLQKIHKDFTRSRVETLPRTLFRTVSNFKFVYFFCLQNKSQIFIPALIPMFLIMYQQNLTSWQCVPTPIKVLPGSNPGRPREHVQNHVAMSRCTNWPPKWSTYMVIDHCTLNIQPCMIHFCVRTTILVNMMYHTVLHVERTLRCN